MISGRTHLAKGVVLAAVLLTLSCAQAQTHIRIASFNIAELGEGNHLSTRDLDAIAEMLVDADLDLIAIQEVGTHDQAEQQFNNLLTAINNRVPETRPRYFSFLPSRRQIRSTRLWFTFQPSVRNNAVTRR